MPLPFGIKLKRTRRYTVSSKSCLVVRIQLLDNGFLEFTLSVESTGQECLEAVAQRLELREINYFSLWYCNKQNQTRWVDLEKPIKKQLDKYAIEPTVYFGVVFYVPTIIQLQQEITRYQYYLQLKKDILEDRIPCTLEQGIQLAGLAVQADFGDYDQYESQDFLYKCDLFPVNWIQDDRMLQDATQKVASLYQKFRGLTPSEAELLYLQEVVKMEGYGHESYTAKDSQGNDLSIGTCLEGIFMKHKNGRLPSVFKWSEISNMSHNKSSFALELVNKEETIQFQTEDMETSKYVWRMCAARRKFYSMNKNSNLQAQAASVSPVRRSTLSRMSLPKPHQFMMPLPQLHYNGHYTEPYKSSQDNLYMNNQNSCFYRSQTSLDRPPYEYNGRIRNGSIYSAHSTSSLNNPQHFMQASPMSSNPSITGSDIMRGDYIPTNRHSAIIPPSYRPTPDYETVMRQLNRGMIHNERQSHSMRNLSIGNSYAYSRSDPLGYSQPEIREPPPFNSQNVNPYPLHLNYSFHCQSPYINSVERRPVVGAVSVPELTNAQLHTQDYSAANMLRTQVYRPPPPYPYPRPANSTPDLSRHLYVSSSNPDLITRRVHHSVQTFQEDSLPVAHSLQEVSEPLTSARLHGNTHKRNSIEIAGLMQNFESWRIKERTISAPGVEKSSTQETAAGSLPSIYFERTKLGDAKINQDKSYNHGRFLSDAAVLIHSSENDEYDSGYIEKRLQMLPVESAAHLPTMLNQPSEPLLDYQNSSAPALSNQLGLEKQARERGAMESVQYLPSVSESELNTVGRRQARRISSKRRPMSEVLYGRLNAMDGLPPLGVIRKDDCVSDIRTIGPLKMAELNGLTPFQKPLPDAVKNEPIQTPFDERCKILEQRLEQKMVFTEYERVPKKSLSTECTVATLPENAERNRFPDVIPYDDTRVELVPTKENNTGYINASHIKVIVGGKEWNYIATQGPLQTTCLDFWQMVWEQGVAIIAMVTMEEEGGREKSFRYWPRLGSRNNSVTYGRFKITTRFRTDSGCYATTGLKIKHLLNGQERTVWHLQYTDWPENGCPEDIKGFRSYLDEIESVRRHTNSTTDIKSPDAPVLVHCSAGVGRTGVVILSEIMIGCLEHNAILDITIVLNLLRQQRMLMVQTIAQYIFVYKVLIHFLRSSRLI
ncbi:tyrosine-protein phosphatase non-receptor type 21 isoform X1 [Hypanus sabinus]|uniref:tyrosine-protein phosphatase non-receptor type 21 isoform X1 n=2 Tax=Hypanus sabinus TaxID=79690 RepID=UPI0028C39EF8|nr:tyrosine-protein phosphatase non-receptor type 21 isoform X1 [Hypanus sabinus]XP_059815654.1 tyrosine-protein phosphatase non-receptor type 21 isoform X1 [Hypanus sabinus]XP_059815662.1 tyrosine-protein phosphatase non-receptor type 21 isoform X1 [Hypanus sabinus]